MASSDACRIEGWLIKKRGDYHKTKFFHYDSMRWFKLQEVKGQHQCEVALCYYKSQKDKEPRGWIFMKDVTEIYDTDNGFTLVSPARTMTIETQNPDELASWIRALIESCPLADISRISTPHVCGPKEAFPSESRGQWCKQPDLDYDEYRPLDRDSLMQLSGSARTSRDTFAASGKTFDRSISLFSRNADGDKNSFYFASSGQTQAMAELPSESHNRSSDEEDGDGGRHRRIISEGETMEQLGDMHRSAGRSGSLPHQHQQGRGRAGPSERGRQSDRDGERDRDRDRDRDSSRGSRDGGERRVGGNARAAGGYGGGDASTSNRLHRHITRDSPGRLGGQSVRSGVRTGGAGADSADSAAPGALRVESVATMVDEPDSSSSNAFNSTSSIQVQRGSPLRARAERGDLSPLGGMEEVDVGADRERVLRSKAMLRSRQQRSKRRQKRGSGSGSASDSESGSSGSGGSADEKRSSSDSGSDDHYGKTSRTAGRARVGSRENDAGEGPRSRQGSQQGTPTQRVFKGGAATAAAAAAATATGKAPAHNSSGGSIRNAVPAPSGAPPRRARDALAQEAVGTVGSPGRAQARESLDEVLRRRPSTEAQAKGGTSSSGGGGRVEPGAAGDSDEEGTEIDFKAELRRYGGSRDGDALVGGGETNTNTSTSTSSANTSTGQSRPPRPPPPINTKCNMYAASAAAVLGGQYSGANQSNAVNTIRRGTSTPPRMAGDPGSKVDRNFVDEDWDAEEEDTSRNTADHKAQQKGSQSARAEIKGGNSGGGAGVRADDNWLEEDFDEN